MIHLAVIGEAGAVLGSAWLVRRFFLFKFGEDSGAVADLLRQARLRALRAPPAAPAPTPDPVDAPPE